MAERIDWRGVVRATLHPRQVEILEAVASCDRMSPIQFCGDLGGVNQVGYHFRALYKAGLLVAAGTAPRRGATEHFYRLAKTVRG
jgi:DNA-binding transcriptional ArsR family regulator